MALMIGRRRGSSRWPCSSSAASSKLVWSGVCRETTAMARARTTLGSDAREAKERLDHKLRGQRQPVVLKRPQMTSTRPPPAKPQHDAKRGGGSDGHHSATTATCGVLLHREVLLSPSSRPSKGGGCRFSWCRRPPAAESEADTECAVCLEELRAGDVVARLPCTHLFHWSCAVPWVQAVSRCPVCRAYVHVAGPSRPTRRRLCPPPSIGGCCCPATCGAAGRDGSEQGRAT